jgi:hypothetical protein
MRASLATKRFQTRTATTEVREGRDFVLRRVYIHHYYTSARKRGKVPPAKKAKKGSARQSLAESSSQTKGLPSMPLDVLFEVKKKTEFSHWLDTHAHSCWNSLDLLESHS